MYTQHYPQAVMRTGVIDTLSPGNVRNPIRPAAVEALTRIPTGQSPSSEPAAGSTNGAVLGADTNGRPVREFHVPGAPNGAQARAAGAALRQAAQILRKTGLETATPALVGGPLASLARGEAIVLRWPNGAVITAAL